MTTPATVWLVVAVASTLLLAVVLAAIVRQLLLIGRTVARFGREVDAASAGIGGRGRGTRR